VQHFDDIQLIAQWRTTADNRCLALLFQRYSHLVSAICLKYLKQREDAQDAAMDIFEKLPVELKKSNITYFKSWLYMVTKNHCLMRLRKAKLPTISEQEMSYPLDNQLDWSESPNHESDIENAQLENLQPCLEQLKTEQKRCVELFFLQEKSYKEIMQITLFEYNAVKSFIQNGRVNLKKCLDSK
jgi:RNA polymerase sigma factor (sigma-70 family)